MKRSDFILSVIYGVSGFAGSAVSDGGITKSAIMSGVGVFVGAMIAFTIARRGVSK